MGEEEELKIKKKMKTEEKLQIAGQQVPEIV